MAWPRAWALSPLFSLLPGVHVKTQKRERERKCLVWSVACLCVCVCVLMRVLVSNGTLRIVAASQAKQSFWTFLNISFGTNKEYLQPPSTREFSHSFEFILYIHVVRSPCGAFRWFRQNLEGDWTNQPSHLGGPIRLATASFATSNSSGFLAVQEATLAPWLSVLPCVVRAKLLPKPATVKWEDILPTEKSLQGYSLHFF